MHDHSQQSVAIVTAKRTPMGSFLGQFSHLSAPELAATILSDMFRHESSQTLLSAQCIDELILGCVLTAGVGQAPARQALLEAGLPNTIPCTTVNKVCGSGLKAIVMGVNAIMAGQAKAILAGGMESMSQAPYLLKGRQTLKMGHQPLLDHLFYDGLENYQDHQLMGHFAEILAASNPEKWGRQQQDDFAIESVKRAKLAQKNGAFDHEITPVEQIHLDEQVRKANIEKIPLLKPVFDKINGTVTAANASSISDGAACVLLMDTAQAKQRELPILGHIVGYAYHAMAPDQFTLANQGAIEKCLKKINWSIDEVDLFEINEAFAIVVLATMDLLGIDHQKVNVHGGACALGHPIGASGCRVVVTLIHALQTRCGHKGIASVCIGGGEAIAIAVEVS